MSNRRRWPLFVLGALIALYIFYFGWYTLTADARCQTRGFDLAIYDQTLWNTIHGRWFRSTFEPGWEVLLADHVEPILLPLSLLYLLWPDQKMLLLIQTLGLALGAVPVYRLACDALQAAGSGRPTADQKPAPSWPIQLSALAFAAAYLLQPALHSANAFEFHPSALATPLLLYALYAMRRRKTALFLLFILLAMSTKEVMPLTTFGVGLYAFFIHRQRAAGAATAALSALWFALTVFVVIPHFNPQGQSHYFSRYYDWLGNSGQEIVVRVLTHPGLVWQRLVSQTGPAYLARLLGPVAYLSLLGLPMLLLALPALVLNALSAAPPQHSTVSFFQYAVAIVPFVVVGALDGTAFLAHRAGGLLKRSLPARWQPLNPPTAVAAFLAGLALVAALIAQRQHGFLPFSRDFYLAPPSARQAALKAIIRQLPPEGSVSSDVYPDPRLSHRESLYLYPEQQDADYILVDVFYRDAPFHARDRYDAIQRQLQSGEYGVRDGRYRYLLLERGLHQPTLPDPFYDFARADRPTPQVKVAVDFGELRLIGYDLVWERPIIPRAYLVLYWQAVQPVERDLRLFFVQTDPSGQPLAGTEMEFVESVWYPPSRWSPAGVIRTETYHWDLETPRQFGVAVGVVEGPGFWEVENRVRPVVQSAPQPLPLIHGDTLLWLTTLQVADQFATLQAPGKQP